MSTPELVLAQQRLATRRAAISQEVSSSSSSRDHTSYNVQTKFTSHPLYDRLKNTIVTGYDQISRREGTRPFSRVCQFDAEQLDEELLRLLRLQVADGLKCYGSQIHHDWAPEITLVLKAILFKLTIWNHNATYGAALQNLQFSDARHIEKGFIAPSVWQKIFYGFTTVGGDYIWTKWGNWVVNTNASTENNRMIKMASNIYRRLEMFKFMAALASFIVFLVNGRYRTITDRIFRLRLVPQSSQVTRQVSFEYLNRQLVWHAFTEFLLFLLPLVGIRKWRKWLTRAWKKAKLLLKNGVENSEEPKSGELAFLHERTCAICYQEQEAEIMASGSSRDISSAQKDITNPYECIPCGCIYCFVCIATRLEFEEGDGWTCLRCGVNVKECKPWNGDVLIKSVRPVTSSKTVIFS